MIPLQVGASDMAFARMNNFSFWLLPPAALLLTAAFFIEGGATGSGRTMYPALSLQMGPGMDLTIFAVHLMGASGVTVFNWIATMWRGSITLETPMLFAIGFIWVFTIGGFSGLLLAIAPIDIQVRDTYYVVAHFHYVLVAGSLFCLFAGFYFRVPKWTGHMYDEWRGKFHFWN